MESATHQDVHVTPADGRPIAHTPRTGTDRAHAATTDPAPRTLIVSWHWPPTNRASAGVLATLFGAAPPGVFRVVTRSFLGTPPADQRETDPGLHTRIPATRVPWPFPENVQPTLRAAPAVVRTVRAMVKTACAIGRQWQARRILAVYPHRLSLLAGWRVAHRLDLPLVLYMHDLCAEGITFRNPLRRVGWRLVDHAALRRAWLILVPTDEFADHYRGRSLNTCWVLPHCAPHPTDHPQPHLKPTKRPQPQQPTSAGRELSLLYAGAVYEPHAGAARAFVAAVRNMPDVRVTFLTPPGACNGLFDRMGARWLAHRDAMQEMRTAHAFVLFLDPQSPCPHEVHGCFPSKLLDYLAAARPILAVVPKGCFVDRLIRNAGCGIVVHDHDIPSIRNAIELLRDPSLRDEMGRSARYFLATLRREQWMDRLLVRLREGPPDRRSTAVQHAGAESHSPRSRRRLGVFGGCTPAIESAALGSPGTVPEPAVGSAPEPAAASGTTSVTAPCAASTVGSAPVTATVPPN